MGLSINIELSDNDLDHFQEVLKRAHQTAGSKSSREITAAVDRGGVAIRCGHMYAYRLCQALGIAVEDGVVRASLVHYNSVDEVERLITELERVA